MQLIISYISNSSTKTHFDSTSILYLWVLRGSKTRHSTRYTFSHFQNCRFCHIENRTSKKNLRRVSVSNMVAVPLFTHKEMSKSNHRKRNWDLHHQGEHMSRLPRYKCPFPVVRWCLIYWQFILTTLTLRTWLWTWWILADGFLQAGKQGSVLWPPDFLAVNPYILWLNGDIRPFFAINVICNAYRCIPYLCVSQPRKW